MRAADYPGRGGLHPDPADFAIPDACAAAGHGDQQLRRRKLPGRRVCRDHATGRGDQRRSGYALHRVDQRERRHQRHHHDLSDRLRSRHRRGGCAEPHLVRHRAAAGRGQPDRHHRQQGKLKLRFRGRRLFARWPLQQSVYLELHRRVREGRAQAHPGRRRCTDFR